ncbi:MAG: hypothetical protein KGI54_15765 [Pseudomonadota bacterium]|nr:hypothetical protein [Pseudomonadota bacterium]
MNEYELMLKRRAQLMRDAHREASAASRNDRSDPFIYDRIYSRIMNGVGLEYGKPGANVE